MRNLTQTENDALAKIVADPVAWWTNANSVEKIDHEQALADKLARHEGVHTDTKAERDAVQWAKDNQPPTFEQKMAQSDRILSRTEEDLADALVANGGTIPDALATKVADKKQLRSAG
jgi:hypothetical protein